MKRTLVTAAAALLAAFLLAGCATTGGGSGPAALILRQVDATAPGSRSFNVIRVETYGPYVQQLYGYFLYRDGITVSVGGRITGKSLGKMTLAEVQQDYQRLLREYMIYGGNLQIREAVLDGTVMGYTASMPALNYTIWNMAADAPIEKSVLQLTFP